LNVEPSFMVRIYDDGSSGGMGNEQGDERVLLAEANEMRGSDSVTTKPGATRYSKLVESGSGSGFGRVACDGIPTDLLSLLEM
jgi:hypothetical protein